MAKEDEKKEDEKLTPVGDGVETSDEKVRSEEAKGEETDEKVGQSAEEDSDEDEDAPDKEGDESLREKIRRQRRDAKKRKQARIISDRRELEFLRRRNEAVERQLSGVLLRQDKTEVATIDGRIGTLESQIREAEQIHTQAVEAKDGATATEALRVKDALRETLSNLKNDRTELVNARKTQAENRDQGSQPVSADPVAVRHGKEWVENNDWFDPELKDEDSYLARAIEERMARSGEYDPRDPEYWEELDRRVAKRLPHLKKGGKVSAQEEADGDEDDLWGEKEDKPQKKTPKKPGGPRIAVGGKTRSLKPNEVYLSSQRIEALKQAGVYDDPEKLQRYLKAYKTYDEEARRNS